VQNILETRKKKEQPKNHSFNNVENKIDTRGLDLTSWTFGSYKPIVYPIEL
jgi:hypothetical protein